MTAGLDLAVRQPGENRTAGLRPHTPSEKRGPNTQFLQKRPQPVVMLLRQNLRWRHQGGLLAILRRADQRGGGNHGLAAAYIPLHQTVEGAPCGSLRAGGRQDPGRYWNPRPY